jgi:hypothetical protein
MPFSLAPRRLFHDEDDEDDGQEAEDGGPPERPVPVAVEGHRQAATHHVAEAARVVKCYKTLRDGR